MSRNSRFIAEAGKGLLGATALTMASRVLVMVSGLVSSVITARALGAEGRGDYFYVITVAQLACQLGLFGLPSTNTYVSAQNPHKLAELAANNIWLAFVFGLMLSTAAGIAEIVLGRGGRAGLVLALFAIVPSMMYAVLASSLLVGLGKTRDYNLFTIVSSILQLAAICVVAALGGGALALLWVSGGIGLASAVYLHTIQRGYGARRWRPDPGILRPELNFAMRSYVTTLCPFIVNRLNVIMIDSWSRTQEVGHYSVAFQIFDTMTLLPSTVALLLFPELVRTPRERRIRRTLVALAWVSAAMAAASLLVAVLATWLVPALFGQEFAPAILVLWMLLPGLVAFSAIVIVSQYMASEGVPLINMLGWALSIPILIALGGALIPERGATGAALALSSTYVLLAAAFLVYVFVWRKRRSADPGH